MEDNTTNEIKKYDVEELTEAYFHGDLDLHSFFKKLGKKIVQKILDEI